MDPMQTQPNNKPIISIIPFEPVLNEINKLQGNKPALLIIFNGVNELLFIKHNLNFKDPIMDKIMQTLTENVFEARGFNILKVEELIDNINKLYGERIQHKEGGKEGSKGSKGSEGSKGSA